VGAVVDLQDPSQVHAPHLEIDINGSAPNSDNPIEAVVRAADRTRIAVGTRDADDIDGAAGDADLTSDGAHHDAEQFKEKRHDAG